MILESICIVLAVIFGITALVLLIKIYLMKKAAREIGEKLSEKLNTDTNTLIDISSNDKDLRALAADLNRQLATLRREHLRYTQGDLELKTAITNISHDLRTPLTAIRGYLDLLDKENLPENAKRHLEIIRERAAAMTALTEELFKYSVILTESSENAAEEVCVNSVLEDSIMGFYAALRENGIEPVVEITEKQIVRRLNRADLSRIFSNLMGNALKYSDGDLRISLDESGLICFENTASSLNGIDVERLFDRFYTVQTSHNTTGLGLSIARNLAQKMGGAITAEYSDNTLCIRITFGNNDLS